MYLPSYHPQGPGSMAELEVGGLKGVLQKHRDGHRTHTARHWRNRAGYLTNGIEIHVADQFAIGQAVRADVDHCSAWGNHVGFEEPGLANGDNHNVGGSSDCRQISTAAMADGNRGVGSARLLHEDQSQRLADDVASSDD